MVSLVASLQMSSLVFYPGFIELVSDSITLREIQSSYGLTGAFKDRPIAEWLQKHNPTGNTYEKVSRPTDNALSN